MMSKIQTDKFVSDQNIQLIYGLALFIFQSVLLIAAFVSKSIYPSSVRFVKNKLKLEGFLNVHMVYIIIKIIKAILPFIFMSNAIVLGFYEGVWGKYWF